MNPDLQVGLRRERRAFRSLLMSKLVGTRI